MFANFADDCHAALFELIGTTFFLLFGLGGIQAAAAERTSNDGGNIQQTLYVATSMGLSLLVSAWLFFRVTGGAFNPNISLALLLVGGIQPVRFVLYCVAQLCGGIIAAALVRALTSAPLAVNTTLGGNTSIVQGIFIEMFITTALVLAVLMLAAEKHVATPFAPIGIGLTLFAAHLFAVEYTGAGMNAARSFGPALISGFPTGAHWVYWLGPFLGSLLGASVYALLKHCQYWKLQPDQATVDHEKSLDPIAFAKRTLSRGGKRESDEEMNEVATGR